MKHYFIFLFLLTGFYCSSQINTNALKKLFIIEKRDTEKVDKLYELSVDYMNSKTDSAIAFAQMALKLSRDMKYVTGEINSLNSLGNIFATTGNYPKALENFLLALKIAEINTDIKRVAIINSNIGLLYAYQEDHKIALKYYFKAKKIAESINNDLVLKLAVSNLGDSYEKLNKLDSALIYTQEGYELALHLKDNDARGISLNNLGNIHSKMGNSILAKAYYKLSIADFIKENDLEGICEDALGLAYLFKKAEQNDSCLYYAQLSLRSANEGGFTKSLLSASSFLSEYYECIQLIDSAFLYQKLYVATKDSLFNQEKTKAMQNLVFDEKIRQQDIAAAIEQKGIDRKKNISLAGIGAFIPLFFGIILLFRKRKTKAKTIDLMGTLGLMFLFELISMIIGPYVDASSRHSTILLFMIQIVVGIILVPVHKKIEHWVKSRLADGHTLEVIV